MPRMDQPTMREMMCAVRIVGLAVGVDRADYCFEGRFGLRLTAGWSLLLSPESAGRICVAACYHGRVRARMWARSDDFARLTALARSAQSEAAALVA